MTEKRTLLTSAEIACLWTGYMNDSMSKCMLGYFLKDIKDEEIHSVVQFAYNLSVIHLEKLTQIFKEENLPIPTGFIDEDVNMNAPRLYTDMFIISYINNMSKVGLVAYSGFISMSVRKDLRDYSREALQETSELYEKSIEVALAKGLFVRAPYIAYPSNKDYIDSHKYLSGFSLFSKKASTQHC